MNKIEQAVIYNKILGSLACAGMGDALGAATELYSIDEIKTQWGGFLNAFVSPPADTFAGSLNGVAGLITDDSSQMYVFSEGLIEAGFDNFTNNDWLACLLRWADMQPYANYKGPTTEQIVKALKEGRPTNTIGRIGTSSRQAPNVGTTNGAGMRVAPAGLIWPGKKEKACRLALITCLPSHDTNIAIASACAIAAATSQAMLPEASLTSLLDAAIWGANYGERLAKQYARCVAGPSIAMRIQLAADIARRANDLESCLREMEGWLVTLLPPMNPFLRQSVYCCTAKENPGKPSMPAPILAMTPIASLRWQAQLQGHGAVLMRSLKINMPFSAP